MLLLAGADAAARAERWWIWRQQVVDLDAMGGGNGGSGQWIWRQRVVDMEAAGSGYGGSDGGSVKRVAWRGLHNEHQKTNEHQNWNTRTP